MLTPILIVVAIGLVAAAMLTLASKVFFVPVDETFAELRAELPGANCGACGYAGCDDYANAMAEDRSLSCSKCPVGGADVAAKLAEILGVEAGSADREVAVVMCYGTDSATKKIMEYEGVKTCVAAKQFFGGLSACPHGCIGLGDCEFACPYNAIKVIDGVAQVDRNACVGCGLCAKACPNSVIRISTEKNKNIVQCRSIEKGGVTRKACTNGCIGCKKCESVCKFDSVHVENNLAFIDPEKCKNCGMCSKVCPTGAIVNMRKPPVKKAAPAKPAAAEAPKAAESPKTETPAPPAS
ncbi:MAG: RnfABCDGE type electron transport complex subunit B [Peptostreptococcaceae bacterium]|nr:RnfABCDGE type electron transport complex subunit B [Peptostreptococcaceae bacterium]MDY5739153.1 RnfABCDGE type electron transport complex subunit B [Anaerovoracaceae bacterium]SFE31912.1 electron transport complex, RnfABCDGE type, B subunit [Peptostreptococcaceae bacterium pGA-8]